MSGVLLVLVGAFVLTLVMTPFVRRLAVRTGQVDRPSARKRHVEPIPLLGGLAMWAAVMLALLALVPAFPQRSELGQLAGMLAGATVVAAAGILDDRRPMSAPAKLLAQALGAALLVWAGVTVSLFGVALVDTLITVVWLVVITNAFNFQDNMDGLAGGLAAVASGAFLALAVANGQLLVAPLSAALLGASLGFVYYNFDPAQIFMGDGGSQFLGFVLAALAIKLRFPERPTLATWMIPVLVLAPVLFDLALVVLSRLRRGVNPLTTAGQDHLSHRLLRLGATKREAALSIWLIGCACGLFAILASYAAYGGPTATWALLGLVALTGAFGLWRLELMPGAPKGLPLRGRSEP